MGDLQNRMEEEEEKERGGEIQFLIDTHIGL